jgi:hypothetical protein
MTISPVITKPITAPRRLPPLSSSFRLSVMHRTLPGDRQPGKGLDVSFRA